MIEALAELLQISQQALLIGFAVFLRIGSAMALLPAFGEQTVPNRVKLVLGFSFTLIVAPAVAPELFAFQGRIPPTWFIAEIMIGLMLGIMLRLFVLALQTAGAIAAQATSLSQLFGGSTGEPQPAVGHLLAIAGLALAVQLGLHVKLAALFIGSYDALPPGVIPDADLIKAWGLSGVAQTFGLSFSIAAPFVLAGLVYNVALGAINRAMPQLMVAFVGAPALTAGGLVLLFLAVPTGLIVWHDAFDAFVANPFQVAP